MAIQHYLNSLRIGNCLIAALGVAAGFLVAAKEIVYASGLAPAMASAFLITAAGNSINDFFDAEIDNRLKKNNEGWKTTWLFYLSIALFAIGIYLSTFIGMHALIIASTVSVLLFAYSALMHKYKFVGNFVVAFGTAMAIMYGSAIVQNYGIVVFLAASAFFANIGREITKDCEDMKGDVGYKRTLPMITGFENIKRIVFTSYVLAIGSAIAAGMFGSFSAVPFTILTIIASYVFFLSWKELAKKNYPESQRLSKIGMLIALAAFICGVLL